MTDIPKKDLPDYKSKSYQEMALKWPYVSDVIKGTLHLRQQRGKYLPKFPSEDKDVYEDRLKTATCYEATGKTRNGLVGLIFRKDPTLSEETPQVIKDHLENADLAGTHWTVFAKEAADVSWEYGHVLLLVDMQPFKEGATHEDDFAPGNRPYWICYKPNQAINWSTAKIGGQTVLKRITFEECSAEEDGEYGEQEVTRYRVLRLVQDVAPNGEVINTVAWKLFRKNPKKEDSEAISLEKEGTFKNVTEIPLSVAYSRKTGFMTSTPPLLNLALLNIKHFQQSSEFDNTLHIVGYPILCSDDAGEDDSETKAIGPSINYRVPKGSNVWYAEPEGSSLEAQRQNLEDKKQEMAVMGISFLAERVSVEQTATEQKINSSERTSDLATAARSLKDALDRSLGFHYQFLGGNPAQAGTVEIADPSELVISIEDIREMSDEVSRGQMSLETFWAMKQKAGRLPSNFDPELERERLSQVQPTI